MSGEEEDSFDITFNKLQQKVEIFKKKRNDLNNRIMDYISSYQTIEMEAYESYAIIKKKYDKNRYYCNEKIKGLRKKRDEYQNLLKVHLETQKRLKKPKINQKNLKSINSLKKSINQINFTIERLEEVLKTTNLNISEENEIVEKIKDLETEKNEKIDLIKKKEKEQQLTQQQTEFGIIQKKIEFVKKELKNIRKQLNKNASQKRKYKDQLIDVLQKVYKLRENKKMMEKELIRNKGISEQYYIKFQKLLYSEKDSYKKRKALRSHHKQKLNSSKEVREKNRELLKKHKQEKLRIALEKKKAGKRLDIQEYRLLMKNKKKK
ncbi:MAG: hypothetical protein ACFFDH_02145 [Promethearchaeota archaeon]